MILDILLAIPLFIGGVFVAIFFTTLLRRLVKDTFAALSASAFLIALALLLHGGWSRLFIGALIVFTHGVAWYAIHQADKRRGA
jgi:ABC-type uncharacterized transport system permease subunit